MLLADLLFRLALLAVCIGVVVARTASEYLRARRCPHNNWGAHRMVADDNGSEYCDGCLYPMVKQHADFTLFRALFRS